MDTKRRYPNTDEFTVYHSRFDLLRGQSSILNEHKSRNFYNPNLADKSELQSLLLRYQGVQSGDNKGYYYAPDDRHWERCKLLALKESITMIEKEWEAYRQRIVQEGRKRPEKMPSNLLIRLHEKQAEYDVAELECEEIQRRLKEFLKEEEKIHKSKVLKFGPHGQAKLAGGRIAILDGQRCGLSPEGVVVIIEKTSPFYGMSTVDYFEHIVTPWGLAKKERRRQLKCEVKQGKRDKMPAKYNAPWRRTWPEGVRNHLIKNTTNDKETRTSKKKQTDSRG